MKTNPPSSDYNKLSVKQYDTAKFHCKVTDVQAILALVVIVKCYLEDWWEHFFWDAWLAVTIQLGLMKKIISNVVDLKNEIFPSFWLHQVFDAELLLEDLCTVKHIIMGNDPLSGTSLRQFKHVRRATGIAFHNVEGKSVTGMK